LFHATEKELKQLRRARRSAIALSILWLFVATIVFIATVIPVLVISFTQNHPAVAALMSAIMILAVLLSVLVYLLAGIGVLRWTKWGRVFGILACILWSTISIQTAVLAYLDGYPSVPFEFLVEYAGYGLLASLGIFGILTYVKGGPLYGKGRVSKEELAHELDRRKHDHLA